MERKREDDIGAKKIEERLTWAVSIVKEICVKEKIDFDKEVFIQALSCGNTLFIQSEKRH